MNTQTILSIHKDPFKRALAPEVTNIRPGQRIDTVLRKHEYIKGRGKNLKRIGTYAVVLNGTPTVQSEWTRRIKKGDLVNIVFLPGNGGGGSNILTIVVAIAVAAVSYGALGLTLFQSAMVGVGAAAALSLMQPPPTQDVSTTSREQASPNYTLSAQNNSARMYEAIPVLYGRFRSYCDLAAQPYIENHNNTQYLYQLLCITQGRVDPTTLNIYIENNPIANIEDAQFQIVEPFQTVSLFPDNVVTSAQAQNLELMATDEPGYGYLGPFPANPAGTSTTTLAVDISLPRGIFRIDNDGQYVNSSISYTFEYQLIDDSGDPIGGWVVFDSNTLTMATDTPQLITLKHNVPAGRYQVRGVRTNGSGDNRTQGNIIWGGLRAYLPSARTYGNVTLLAVIVKATNTLNSNVARRFSVEATRMLPTWNPVDGWGPEVPTKSIAWAFADACRNADYGRGLPTSRINIQELYRLDSVWASRGDEFNGIFDKSYQFWDALTKIATVGRSIPMHYASIVDIVRNEPQTQIKQMFQPENILAGSWSTKYKFAEPNSPDYIIGAYKDPVTWEDAQVDAVLPGESATKSHTQNWFGITNRDQAWRESISLAAKNRDQRRITTFTVPGEGLLCRYNDLVGISYDTSGWGYSGKVESWNATTKRLVSNKAFVFEAGKSHLIGIRGRNGSMLGPWPCVAGANAHEVILTISNPDAAALYISNGIREEKTFYQFGVAERMNMKALVAKAKPNKNGTVTLTVVNYAESVYTAETGGVVPPPGPISNLPKPPSAPIVDFVRVEETLIPGQQKIVASPASGASFYEFEARKVGTSLWTNFGVYNDPFITTHLSPGDWEIRARAIGSLTGPWATWTGTLSGNAIPVPDLVLASYTSQFSAIRWDFVLPTGMRDIIDHLQIYMSLDDVRGNAVKLEELPYPSSTFIVSDLKPNDERWFWFRIVDKIGRIGDWYNGGVGLKATPVNDPELLLEYLNGAITEGQLAPGLIEDITTIVGEDFFDSIFGNLTGDDEDNGGDWFTGDDETYPNSRVGNRSVLTVIQEPDLAQVRKIDTIAAENAEFQAAVQTEIQVISDENSALAQQVVTVGAKADNAESIAQQSMDAYVDADGNQRATHTVKVSVRNDDKTVVAGTTLGVSIDQQGVTRSEFYVLADIFGVLGNLNGTISSPFVFDTVDQIAYFNAVMIKDATISFAKIINNLQSSNFSSNVSGWRLDKNGTFQLNGPGGTGRLLITNNLISVYDASNVLRVRMGLW